MQLASLNRILEYRGFVIEPVEVSLGRFNVKIHTVDRSSGTPELRFAGFFSGLKTREAAIALAKASVEAQLSEQTSITA